MGEAPRILITKIETGSIAVMVTLETGVCCDQKSPLEAARDLKRQVEDPKSKLKLGRYTSKTTIVQILSIQEDEPDIIEEEEDIYTHAHVEAARGAMLQQQVPFLQNNYTDPLTIVEAAPAKLSAEADISQHHIDAIRSPLHSVDVSSHGPQQVLPRPSQSIPGEPKVGTSLSTPRCVFRNQVSAEVGTIGSWSQPSQFEDTIWSGGSVSNLSHLKLMQGLGICQAEEGGRRKPHTTAFSHPHSENKEEFVPDISNNLLQSQTTTKTPQYELTELNMQQELRILKLEPWLLDPPAIERKGVPVAVRGTRVYSA